MKHFIRFAFAALLLAIVVYSHAQPGSTIELKKPEKYENRKLGSEKTQDKKFGIGRHIYQDLITHYNYYFNANNRLNDIILNAKSSFKDDYTKLLPFYNYTLDVTSQSKSDIDSIIYKCTAGILLHDLRNDWIDNLYMILGKAYFYRKDFDSAAAVFQYVNYAFAPKDDGYDIPIGSNTSNQEGIFTIATKEKKSLIGHEPSRNNAFLWLAKTLIETGNPEQASGILEIVRHDPNFPERLNKDLHETLAYWFYNQHVYDSAAYHLTDALDNANNQFERARWEFLVGQLYQLNKDSAQAFAFYNRSASHTPDPVMEVYANLNSISMSTGDKQTVLQQKLNNLLKLAKKDRYVSYRDIIYYAAAKVELERGDEDAAKSLLLKSVKYSVNNPEQKAASFLLLADLNYNTKQFQPAYNFYDSTSTGTIKDSLDQERVSLRHTVLKTVTDRLTDIHNEDSLQHLASLPAAQRDAILKKALRQMRREQGLKEDADNSNNSVNPAVQLQSAPDLFSSSSKGDWYFNNNSLKSRGFTEFRQVWGNRPNVDNWRREADIQKMVQAQKQQQDTAMEANKNIAPAKGVANAADLTVDDLKSRLPLTEEQLQKSNENIADALFKIGETLQNQLEYYGAAIDYYEELNKRFINNQHREASLFDLYYCYNKTGNAVRADSCLALLKKDYANGKWAQNMNQKTAASETSNKNPATKEYEHIYDKFLSGNFEEAEAEKAKADSIYGNTYWSPQLLFIESIYYVSKKEDSTAINKLNELSERYASSPLAEKAKTMIDVLSRRKEIENYLTNLEVTREEDEAAPLVNLQSTAPVVEKKEIKQDSVITKTLAPVPVRVDTAHAAPVTVKTFTFNPSQPQYVLLLLDSVAPVFANEAKNAFDRYNKGTFYNQRITITNVKLDDRYNLVLLGPFTDAVSAMDYVNKTRPLTASRILPWLTANKFSYAIISEDNLDLLKDNKDVEGYKKLLQKAMPDKF